MDDPTPPGLRERKQTETRLALEAAALHLVHANGLENVTVEQIAERANVSTRTFFNYFSSKEDALLSSPGKLSLQRAPALFPTEPGPGGTYQALKEFCIDSFDEWSTDDALLEKRILVLAANPVLAKRQVSLLTQQMDEFNVRVADLLRAEDPARANDDTVTTQARMLLFLCASAIHFTMDSWRASGSVTDPADSLRRAFHLLEETTRQHLATAGEHCRKDN